MARINIEDNIESQKEWRKLMRLLKGDDEVGLGKLVKLFRLCQDHYGDGTSVPAAQLREEGLECMIESGWVVEQKGGGFQVKNPEKHFDWYVQMKESTSRAGRVRAAAGKRDENGRFLPRVDPAERQRPLVKSPADAGPATSALDQRTSAPAPAPSPAPVLKKSTFSFFDERQKREIEEAGEFYRDQARRKLRLQAPPFLRPQDLEALATLYGLPEMTLERLKKLINAYVWMQNDWFDKMGRNLPTMLACLNQVMVVAAKAEVHTA